MKGESTAHLSGVKKVFLSFSDSQSDLTQFAYGCLIPGESIATHLHASMEEFFYFVKGKGVYTVGDEQIPVKSGTFVRILPKKPHMLKNIGEINLEFVYFGIEVD